MVPDTYHDFFLASVGASAALVGLLFVAISLAPERVFGTTAQGEHLAFAVSAFIALCNIFFISLAALLPYLNIGIAIVVAGGSGLVNTLLLGVDIWARCRRLRASSPRSSRHSWMASLFNRARTMGKGGSSGGDG